MIVRDVEASKAKVELKGTATKEDVFVEDVSDTGKVLTSNASRNVPLSKKEDGIKIALSDNITNSNNQLAKLRKRNDNKKRGSVEKGKRNAHDVPLHVRNCRFLSAACARDILNVSVKLNSKSNMENNVLNAAICLLGMVGFEITKQDVKDEFSRKKKPLWEAQPSTIRHAYNRILAKHNLVLTERPEDWQFVLAPHRLIKQCWY